jgi:hypothetical protein
MFACCWLSTSLIVQQMVANCQSAENIVNWQQINEME